VVGAPLRAATANKPGGDEAMSESLLAACALVLVIEGLLPFIAPQLWRDAFRRLGTLSDGQLRFMGLASIGFGIVLLLAVT
jgi:uncharacterized protein YjeT (DUF2065 family)